MCFSCNCNNEDQKLVVQRRLKRLLGGCLFWQRNVVAKLVDDFYQWLGHDVGEFDSPQAAFIRWCLPGQLAGVQSLYNLEKLQTATNQNR
jgi:hypothetical protein